MHAYKNTTNYTYILKNIDTNNYKTTIVTSSAASTKFPLDKIVNLKDLERIRVLF